MKKKIALFLAAAMTIAAVMPMTVLADTKLRSSATSNAGNTLFLDPTMKIASNSGDGGTDIDADYVSAGNQILIDLKSSDFRNADVSGFDIRLTNADWNFLEKKAVKYPEADWETYYTAHTNFAPTVDANGLTTGTDPKIYYTAADKAKIEAQILANLKADVPTLSEEMTVGMYNVALVAVEVNVGGTPTTFYKFDSDYCVFQPATYNTNEITKISGNSYKFDDKNTVDETSKIPYTLTVSTGSSSVARISYDPDEVRDLERQNYTIDYTIAIPLVSISDEDADCIAEVTNSYGIGITEGKHTYSRYSAGQTNTTISTVESYETFALKPIVITEKRYNVIKAGWLRLEFPDEYEIVDTYDIRNDKHFSDIVIDTVTGALDMSKVEIKYDVEDNDTDSEHSAIYINLVGYQPTTTRYQELTISNVTIKIKDTDTEKFGDINLKISAIDKIGKDKNLPSSKITSQTVVAAKRVAEDVTITAGTAPSIYNGRRNEEAGTIKFAELTAGSWDMKKDNTLTLVDEDGVVLPNVKISGIEFSDFSNISNTITDEEEIYNDLKEDPTYEDNEFSSYLNSAGKYDINGVTVTLKDQTATFKGFTATKAAKMTIKFYLSAEAGFTGDVYVLPKLKDPNTVFTPLLIAKVTSPVEVTTKTTQVQVGYSMYPVADVTITEAETGILEKGNLISMQIYSSVGTAAADMSFVAIKAANNVKVDDKSGLKLNLTKSSGKVLSFEVTTASKNEAATIQITGLALYINRNASQGDYSLIVGGNAIVDNDEFSVLDEKYTASNRLDTFETEGVPVPKYVVVATEGADVGSTKNVQVTEDSATAIIDGQTVELGAPTKIVEGSLFVPVRFIAQALGLDDKNVIWDPIAATCTIVGNANRMIVFKENSDQMTINGQPITMTDLALNPVKAQIIGDRMYIPFRKLGDAFGITVVWHEDTKMAEYNPK